MDCITLGEPLICFDSGQQPLDAASVVQKYVVGAESNVAIGLARLGRSVAYIGRVGSDSLGREIRRTLRGEGVDASGLVVAASAPTGVLLKERSTAGRTEVTYHRAGSAGSTLSVADLPARFAGIRRLHVTGITLVLSPAARRAALEAMRRARADGCRVSLDANFRRKLAPAPTLVDTFEEAAGLADEILLGRGEAALCAGSDDDAALEEYARSLSAETVVLKGVGGGASAFARHERIELEPGTVPVVDAVGAGDGFAVGFLHALLDGAPIVDALELAGRVAARVVSTQGDYQGLPYAEDLLSEPARERMVLR
ncbi:sugar kinase [Agromyces sp. NPDC056523]|uniref:sugar kinase n=1 Tax=Agromyces sp. NPDC056523 TaxID=3345850 RepID=UPI003672573F